MSGSEPAADRVGSVVAHAVAVVLELDPAQVRPQTRLKADLGADSLALVEIAEIVETDLGRPGVIPDEELDRFDTVDELIRWVREHS